MSFTVPPAKMFTDPLVSLPTWYNKAPTEGDRFVPLSIDWGKNASTGKSIQFEIPNAPAPVLSQICALSVDNSQCGSDVVFYFPDSQQTYTVPAYAPGNVFPVFTGSLTFYVVGLTSEAGDKTNVQIFNNLPPPIALPRAELQSVSAHNGATATAGSTFALIAAGVNGTLEYINIQGYAYASAANFGVDLTITDGNSNVLAIGSMYGTSTQGFSGSVVTMQNCAVQFINGVNMQISSPAGYPSNGWARANLLYRTP